MHVRGAKGFENPTFAPILLSLRSSMCACACVHVCVHACMCVAPKGLKTHLCSNPPEPQILHVCMCVCACVHVCVHACMCVAPKGLKTHLCSNPSEPQILQLILRQSGGQVLQHVAGEELDLVLVLQPLQQGQTQLHAVTWPRLPQVFQRLVPGHRYKCNSGCVLYGSFLEIPLF